MAKSPKKRKEAVSHTKKVLQPQNGVKESNLGKGNPVKGETSLGKTDVKSLKEDKVYQNLYKAVVQFIQGKSYKPSSFSDLFQRLHFAAQYEGHLKEILNQLLDEKKIQLSKGLYEVKRDHIEVVSGILRLHHRGFGFVVVDKPTSFEEDIFIPKHLTGNAVDGDHVEVQVDHLMTTEKGPEGKIVSILSRGRTHIAGIIKAVTHGGDVLAHVPILGASQKVIVEPHRDFKFKVGDRLILEVIEWGKKQTETICRASHYIGHITDPSCDISAALEEFQIQSDFPHHVVEEAKNIGTRVSQKDIQDREDFRHLECFTIDPDSAKDFDDALSLRKDKNGHYHLGVHIADVSHYVQLGTALDEEAQKRCNSTYFPGRAVPMLPSALSDNLCSLKANVNRLTVSVLMHFDEVGTLVDYRIARSVIKSAKRFTYKEAKLVLDGKKASKHLPTLNLMVELCKLLKRKRYERGSIEFSLPELVVVVNEKGKPYKTDYVEYDITHQMVEEFMLKANEIVATHLDNQGKNLTYRVHDEPSDEHLKDFALLARAFGFTLSDKPTPEEMRELFDEAANTPYGPYLATSYIRRMRLATYSADNIGHYGLGLTHYCHFTSPIRRYVDLVAHRILFGAMDERDELEMIAERCSEQERVSAKAEGNVVLLKKLRLLEEMNAKERHRQYDAVVTRVKNFGVVFEVLELMLEGFLHISELGNDYYVFDESKMRLQGAHRGGGFSAGDRITVMLVEVDLILLETQWAFVLEKKRPYIEEVAPSRRSEKRKTSSTITRKPFSNKRKPLPKKSRKSPKVSVNKGKSRFKDKGPKRPKGPKK